MNRRDLPSLLAAAVLLILALSIAVSFGSVKIPFPQILQFFAGKTEALPDSWRLILMRIRLPRALAAAMVGGVLAAGGVSCQGIFRNPLSEPYLLGISSGAALGATIAIVYLGQGNGGGLGVVGIAAFCGALTVTAAVFAAAGRMAFRLPSTLLLTGIAVAFLCQSVIWLLMTLHRDQVERITFWTLGSLSSAGWVQVIWLAALTLPVTLILAAGGRILDVLSTGYHSAHSLGVRPQRAAFVVLLITAMGTAAAVAVAGSIGFVGLMVPHISRLTGGPSHRSLLVRSWFGGAILLVFADLAARTVNPPGEIPVGVITALLGAPFLLILSRTRAAQGRMDG